MSPSLLFYIVSLIAPVIILANNDGFHCNTDKDCNIYCPTDYTCNISCIAPFTESAHCTNIVIDASKSISVYLQISSYSAIYCPVNGACFIDCISEHKNCTNMDIHASESSELRIKSKYRIVNTNIHCPNQGKCMIHTNEKIFNTQIYTNHNALNSVSVNCADGLCLGKDSKIYCQNGQVRNQICYNYDHHSVLEGRADNDGVLSTSNSSSNLNTTSSSMDSKNNDKSGILLDIIIAVLVVVIALIICCLFFVWKRMNREEDEAMERTMSVTSVVSMQSHQDQLSGVLDAIDAGGPTSTSLARVNSDGPIHVNSNSNNTSTEFTRNQTSPW